MDFFQRFPTVNYIMTEGGVSINRTVPNMTVALDMVLSDEEGTSFSFYRIKDRDRPDTVAAQFYGSSRYAWIILLANKMRDWYDWPLTDEEFYHYMARKYESVVGLKDGITQAKDTVHERLWLRPDGQRLIIDHAQYLAKIAEGAQILSGISAYVPTDGQEAVCIVSKYDDEQSKNDAARLIRVPSLSSIGSLDQRLSELLGRR